MNTSTTAINFSIMRVAVMFSAIALLVAPFRSSAGVRAGLLVLALGIICYQHWRASKPLFDLPSAVSLRLLVLTWVSVVFIYCLTSADWRTSLAGMRGGIITPILAAIVMFNLMRSPRDLRPILLALFAGLIVLTAMIVMDPFRPAIGKHEPHYIGVGWLSTWVMMLAALLPLGWHMPWKRPLLARRITAIAALAILTAAWFSGNRIIWICFAMMATLYIILQSEEDSYKRRRVIPFVIVIMIAGAALFTSPARFVRHSSQRLLMVR